MIARSQHRHAHYYLPLSPSKPSETVLGPNAIMFQLKDYKKCWFSCEWASQNKLQTTIYPASPGLYLTTNHNYPRASASPDPHTFYQSSPSQTDNPSLELDASNPKLPHAVPCHSAG